MLQILKVLFVFACFFISTNAVVKIDIDPEELQSIGEVLVESYFTHNLIQRVPTMSRLICSKTLETIGGTSKLVALTMSFVSANFLTAVYQPKLLQWLMENDNKTTTLNSIKPSELCPYDFGCDDYMCWRGCDSGKKDSAVNSWCYSAPQPEKHQFQHCVHSHECSPCWDCIGPCNPN